MPPPPHVRAVRVPIHWWLISKNHLVRSAISFSMKCYWSNSPTIVWRSFTCKSKKILILTFVLEILGCTYCKFSILQLIYITNDMIYMQLILHQQIPASSVHKHDIPKKAWGFKQIHTCTGIYTRQISKDQFCTMSC